MRRHRVAPAKGIGYRAIGQLIVIIGLPVAVALPLSNLIIAQMQLPKILFLFLFPMLFVAMIAVGVGVTHLVKWFGKSSSTFDKSTSGESSSDSKADSDSKSRRQ